MNIFFEIKKKILDDLSLLIDKGTLPSDIIFHEFTVEPPKDKTHGEISTNVAMILAKSAKLKPIFIAETLKPLLLADKRIKWVKIANPGFINVKLEAEAWQQMLEVALDLGEDFGKSNVGKGKKINIEYVSANPTGPLHVGHTRGAVFGDALANLLAYVGYDVTREYYVNDGGNQINVLARSVYQRYLECFGREISFEEGAYPGDYLIDVAEALKEEVGDSLLDLPEEEWLSRLRIFSTDRIMKIIKKDLESLGVYMDIFTFENEINVSGKIQESMKLLEEKKLIYSGILEPPKGKLLDDWEPREQTLFRSTNFGDDVDRPVKKFDGGWTYFAPDIAYHFDKVKRGYDELIDIFGADHSGYVKRMKAAVNALSDNTVIFDIKLCQLVRLYKKGVPFKMSKRSGTFVTLRDVIDEVGPDVVRFMMLTRKNDVPLDFDFDKALEQSKDNAVFYVQYAHARCSSILRRHEEITSLNESRMITSINLNLLGNDHEQRLIFKVSEWPRVIQLAVQSREPHRIVFYLYEIASDFHSWQHEGKVDRNKRILVSKNDLAQARLLLLRIVKSIISSGMKILGVTPLTKM